MSILFDKIVILSNNLSIFYDHLAVLRHALAMLWHKIAILYDNLRRLWHYPANFQENQPIFLENKRKMKMAEDKTKCLLFGKRLCEQYQQVSGSIVFH